MTGVPNRWVFFDHFERELARSRRYGLPLSCVLCDIDFFKPVNDTHGHLVGDVILKSFAQIINAQCRASDHLCRYGGEEFCILLTDTAEAPAVLWAERIRTSLGDMVLPTHGRQVTVTASFGVAQWSDGVESASDLLDRADSALRIAKHTGRDRVVGYSQVRDGDGQDDSFGGGCRERFRGVQAGQLMTAPIICLNHNQPMSEAADLLLRMRVNSLPVVGDDGRLAGIVSEKDLMVAPTRAEIWRAPLRDVMKTNVVCYDEETPVSVIYDFLCRVTIRRVIIVKGDRPTGTISRGTMLRWLRNWQLGSDVARPPSLPEVTDRGASTYQEHLCRVAAGLDRQIAMLRDEVASGAADVRSVMAAR